MFCVNINATNHFAPQVCGSATNLTSLTVRRVALESRHEKILCRGKLRDTVDSLLKFFEPATYISQSGLVPHYVKKFSVIVAVVIRLNTIAYI
jgi:hypothetical protein